MIECDVRQIWLCQSSIAQAEEKFGRIDVVVNTASKSIYPLKIPRPPVPFLLLCSLPQSPLPCSNISLCLRAHIYLLAWDSTNNSICGRVRRNQRLELPRTTRSKLLWHSKYNPLRPPWYASTTQRTYHQYHGLDWTNRHAKFEFVVRCSSCCGGIL